MIALIALLGLAWAQDVGGNDNHGRAIVPTDGDPQDPLWGYRAERQLAGSFGAGVTLQYAESPLVRVVSDGDTETSSPALDNVLGATIGGQFAIHERAAIGLSAPLWLLSQGAGGSNGFALGDIRLSAPVGLVIPGEQGEGLGLAIVPMLDLPSGAADAWLGDSGVGGGALASVAYGTGKLLFVADAGVMTAPKIEVANLVGGPQLIADASAAYLVSKSLAVRLEGRVDPSLAGSSVPFTAFPAELGLNTRYRSGDNGLSFTGGLTTALTRGASAARYRVFLGVGYTGRKTWVEPVYDTDGDGLLDNVDACPLEPETVNQWKDDDGCPDGLAHLTITVVGPDGPLANAEIRDGETVLGVTGPDGTLRLADKLPETAFTLKSAFAKHGTHAPVAVKLAEGEQSARIELPLLPGKLVVKVVDKKTKAALPGAIKFKTSGAPAPSTFGPEGSNIELARGSYNAFVESDGYKLVPVPFDIQPEETVTKVIELERSLVKMQAAEIQILDKVQFERAKADIMPVSHDLLTEVATVLLANPQVKLVEVQGHTDSDGNDAYNLNLSQARVDSVMKFLIERGVEPSRLVAKGYGETQPMVPNTTKDNKAINRRVQFIILQQDAKIIEVEAPLPGSTPAPAPTPTP